MARLAVVTDSTAQLDPAWAEQAGVVVVPLQVIVDDVVHDEGDEAATPAQIAQALRTRHRVSTSRPGPERLVELYERLASEGVEGILSVHLSAEVSGTYESALLAARRVEVATATVDTRQIGMATGYAVRSAVAAIEQGADLARAAQVARERALAATSLFYVDTLEYLRRGGRVGAAAALMGGVLAVKPILAIEEGSVRLQEKVRTSSRALARLADLAVEAAQAADGPVDVEVAHLDNEQAAARLTEQLAERIDAGERGSIECTELTAVLGVHAGPGTVGVCVAPRRPDQG